MHSRARARVCAYESAVQQSHCYTHDSMNYIITNEQARVMILVWKNHLFRDLARIDSYIAATRVVFYLLV